MSPMVCFTQYNLESRAIYIACVTIFVYLVVHGVWKSLDRKFGNSHLTKGEGNEGQR